MISIIFPTLNEEAWIGGTISALKSKLTLPHEIIVSDGKSKDRTAEIARQHADKVVVYDGEKRQTIGQGRNAGAAVAAGEFLVFMDADCTIEDPDAFFTRALADFKDEKVVALAAWLKVTPELATFMDNLVFGIQNRMELIYNNFFHFGFAPGEFQMMRKSSFEKLGGYNPILTASEDLEMFKRLSRIGRTHVDSKLVVLHSGRRAHKIGWAPLLTSWFLNMVWMTFFGRAYSKEWKVIR